MWNTYDTCLTCVKLGQAGKAMRYIKGELKPHYPVPAILYRVDISPTRVKLWAGRRYGMLAVFKVQP